MSHFRFPPAIRRALGRSILALLAAGALAFGPVGTSGARADPNGEDLAAAVIGIAVVAVVGVAIAQRACALAGAPWQPRCPIRRPDCDR